MRVLIGAAAIVLLIGAAVRGQTTRPNILLILSDDQSAPHVGCYGNKDVHTPTLDKLASEGMRFDRAYVICPQCMPSRSAILTGRHPVDIGTTRFSAPLPRDVILFPEMLRAQRGYFAGLCGRNYHLDGTLLDKPEVAEHLVEHDYPKIEERLDYVRKIDGSPTLRKRTFEQYHEFLDKWPKDKPFFLQLCWSDPHRPFTKEELPYEHDAKSLSLPPFYPDSPEIRQDLASYYDEVCRMDSDTGRVLKTLDEMNLTSNTIVIFMGDNGASQFRGKGTLTELGVHVPLIIRWPGVVKPGTASSALVSGEDLAPTVLEIEDIERPGNLTGVSFLRVLKDATANSARDQIVAERGPHATALPRGSASFDLGRAIVTDQYKLIYNVMWQLPYQPVDFKIDEVRRLDEEAKLPPNLKELLLADQRPMFELYDLKSDPWEMHNLIDTPDAKKVEQDLKARLTAWMIHHADFVPLPMPGNKKKLTQGEHNEE